MSSRSSVPERSPRTAPRSAHGVPSHSQPLHARAAATQAGRLALDGDGVAALIGVKRGPQIGAALRWLDAQVGENPQLNTRAALSALLRFAPRSAWDPSANARSGDLVLESAPGPPGRDEFSHRGRVRAVTSRYNSG